MLYCCNKGFSALFANFSRMLLGLLNNPAFDRSAECSLADASVSAGAADA